MDNDPQTRGDENTSPLLQAAALGQCPRCGARTMFASTVRFAERCRDCGLDYGRFNVGDGPAAFLTLIIGGLIAVLAIVVDMAMRPPIWVHVLLWVPLTTVAVVGGLRLAKGILLTIEYRRGAREAGGIDLDSPPADHER